MSETKVLPVGLTQEQRKRLGLMAAEKCVSMTELLRWWIEEKWAGHVNGVTVDRKKPSVKSQSIAGVPVPDAELVASHGQEATRRTGGATPPTGANLPKPGVPVEYDVEPVKHQCAICRVSFPELEMTYHPKTMKWACKDCVDNQRNGQ